MDAQSITSILSPPQKEATPKTNDILGKDDFLKMLTAQLQYQNPMDPMNDEQFVSQMAQFSSLEQLQNMNSTLSQNVQWNMLLSQTINNTMATSLIGKEITVEGNNISLQGDSGTDLSFTADDNAVQGTIEITNSEGKVVRTIDLTNVSAGPISVHWDGKDQLGNQMAAGDYTFNVSLKDGKGNSVSSTSFLNGIVEGVKYINGQAMLLVDGSYIPLSQVREVKGGQP